MSQEKSSITTTKSLLTKYDGLLLVHPDWYTFDGIKTPPTIGLIYGRFRAAQEYCNNNKILFMVALSTNRKLSSLVNNIGLTQPVHTFYREDSLNLVSNIASIVNKESEQINILFGGFKHNACVRNWVANYCTSIEQTHEDRTPIEDWISKNRFFAGPKLKAGQISYELTDYNL